MLTPAVLFALFLVFLGLTWTLSLAESAFSYLSRRDAEDIVREQPGSKVLEIARERESHLGALRVWRFVAEALSAVCLTAAADAVVDDTWLAVAIAAVVLVGVAALLGVWSPRPIGSRNEAAVARRLGGLVWVLRRALGPLAARLDRDRRRREVEPEDEDDFQERHLREFVARAHDADVLADSEAELIQSVFSMNDTIVRSVMVPRTDVVTIDADHTLGQAMALFLRSGNSRIPVIGEDADDIRACCTSRMSPAPCTTTALRPTPPSPRSCATSASSPSRSPWRPSCRSCSASHPRGPWWWTSTAARRGS